MTAARDAYFGRAAAQRPEAAADGTRKRLLVRAAIATAMMALLLAGLELFDDDGDRPSDPAPVPLTDAGPTTSAPSGEAQREAPVVSAVDDAPAAAGTIVAAPTETGAPAATGGDAVPLVAASVNEAAPVAPEPASPPPEAAEAQPPAPPPTPAAADAPALGPGYIVQLGVFAAPANAESLRNELAAQGYPAHVQSRVVLGPFADLKAAKRAEERLRRERKLGGIIVAPRKP
jgi:DedD protein